MTNIFLLSVCLFFAYTSPLHAEKKTKRKALPQTKTETPIAPSDSQPKAFAPETVVAPVSPVPNSASSLKSPLGVVVGAHVGAASGKLSQTGTTFDSRTGFALGVSGEYRIDEWLHVQPELNYVQKGAKFTNTTGEQTYKLDSIEIPVLVKAKFDAGTVKPFMFAGPAIGFTLGNTMEAAAGGSIAVATKGIEFGAQFGVGAETRISDGLNINASGRYSLGFTDLFQTTGANAQSRQFIALIGVAFTNLNI